MTGMFQKPEIKVGSKNVKLICNPNDVSGQQDNQHQKMGNLGPEDNTQVSG